jgi:hypothetical protein
MTIGLTIFIWLMTAALLIITLLARGGTPESSPILADGTTVVSRRPAAFTERYAYVDGVEITVVEVNHGKLLASVPVDDPNARTGDPSSELTVIVRNGSDHLVRVALTARLRYGPGRTVAGSYVATTGHADHATVQYIAPGDTSYPYRLGFLLPVAARDDVVLDVGIDNGIHERAIFAGSIKAD